MIKIQIDNVSDEITSEAVESPSALARVISYIPYGEIFVEQQSGGWQSPYLFNSKELDSETGLYYYGARYLDPSEGMWLSVDPLWEKYVGMSPYGYCAGNPVGLVDVDGRKFDLSNLTDKQREIFISTIDKLKNIEGEVGEVISFLNDNENFTITIFMNEDGKNRFDQDNNLVNWDSDKFIVTDLDFELTPEVLLSHELKHSYDFNKDYDKPIGQGLRYIEQLEIEESNVKHASGKHEDSAIEFETKVAHALKQIPQDAETTRTDYVSKSIYRKETEEK